jgi:hypothetical protein
MLVCSESVDTAFLGQDTARLHRFILKHSSKKVRIRMSCSKRCKANYLWEPQRVYVRAAFVVRLMRYWTLH